MKKIGIITICGNNNYGNRLQNYALIKIVDSMGFESHTIWPKLNLLRNISIRYKNRNLSQLDSTRINNFKNFTDSYTKPIFLKYNKNIGKKYEKLIVGSDQIWNLEWQLWLNKFLIKIEKNKIIAYAPSFGVSKIKDSQIKWYRKIINNVKYLSIREDRGKEIIEELTGRKDAKVLIDPTMLLKSDVWDEVSLRPIQLDKYKDNKYILMYFLGDISQNNRLEIERVAKENNCIIINILDKNSEFYTCGPSEFLYLIKNAFLICTDSFHSSVFSFLYNRPFIVYNREKAAGDMSSRLDTLISKFNLKDRRYNGKRITKENLNHDYTEAYKILETEREKSKKFLEKALDIEDNK